MGHVDHVHPRTQRCPWVETKLVRGAEWVWPLDAIAPANSLTHPSLISWFTQLNSCCVEAPVHSPTLCQIVVLCGRNARPTPLSAFWICYLPVCLDINHCVFLSVLRIIDLISLPATFSQLPLPHTQLRHLAAFASASTSLNTRSGSWKLDNQLLDCEHSLCCYIQSLIQVLINHRISPLTLLLCPA